MKISVITPIYNGESHLDKFIDLLKKITYEDIEYIFVNNNSTDNSISKLKILLQQSNLNYCITNETIQGAGFARNTGIKKAKGEYLAFLDCDDAIEPNKFKYDINLINNFNVDFVFCRALRIYEDGRILKHPIEGIKEGINKEPDLGLVWLKNFFHLQGPGSMLIKKKVVLDLGCFHTTRTGEDAYLFIRMGLLYKGYFYDKTFFYYFRHTKSTVSVVNKEVNGRLLSYFNLRKDLYIDPIIKNNSESQVMLSKQLQSDILNLHRAGLKINDLINDERLRQLNLDFIVFNKLSLFINRLVLKSYHNPFYKIWIKKANVKSNKKIKILYTIPNFDTAGSGKALLNLALNLNKELFEPQILCLNTKGYFFKVVAQSGIPVHVFNYLAKERPFHKMLINCWDISRKLKKINPDIIHSFHYSSNYTEALSAKLAGIQWTFTKKNMSWGGSSKNRWKLRSFLAKKIIVQNKDMIKQFYPNSTKTSLIPRGVVTEKFKKTIPDFQIKQQMNTNENQRVLICVANFVPVKGIEVLIDAFETVHKKNPSWVVWLVGDDQNEYGLFLKEKVKNLNLTAKIIFSGKQMDVRSYLNHAELFVLPTLAKGEGSPVALLEAMANGKVVIGSRVSGISDQLENYGEHLFTPKNSEELAEKLRHFMKMNKEELNEMGSQFLKLVTESYSIEVEVNRHEKLYLSL